MQQEIKKIRRLYVLCLCGLHCQARRLIRVFTRLMVILKLCQYLVLANEFYMYSDNVPTHLLNKAPISVPVIKNAACAACSFHDLQFGTLLCTILDYTHNCAWLGQILRPIAFLYYEGLIPSAVFAEALLHSSRVRYCHLLRPKSLQHRVVGTIYQILRVENLFFFLLPSLPHLFLPEVLS